jgi:preprotein translocase subunit SecD
MQMRCSKIVGIFALLSAATAIAGTPTSLAIGGEHFTQSEILDARYLPSIDGQPMVMVTLSESAALRLQDVTKRNIKKAVAIVVDGKTIVSPTILTPIETGVIEIGGIESAPAAIALAKQISGKDPLPDSLEE